METTAVRSTPSAERRTEKTSWVLLAFGVLAASFSAILVRYAQGADPLAISFWRCAAGAAALMPFASPRLRRMTPRALAASMVAGAFLAIHFATWITSLQLTSVASAVLLVTASPIFVAAMDRGIFGRRLSGAGWLGIAGSVLGSALVVGGDFRGDSLLGDGLAVAGCVAVSVYTLAGREARREVGVLEYASVAYAVAAVLLLASCTVAGAGLTGYDATTWWAIAGLAAGPQLLGHTVINLILKHIDATAVSVAVMGEPVLATILAFFLFSETPTAWFYPGAVAILWGIWTVSRATRPDPVVPE